MRRKRPIRSRRSSKLTASALRKLVVAESRKLQREALSGKLQPTEKVKAEEYEAGEEANTLEKDIDHVKVLKIQERRLRVKLKRIKEAQSRVKRKILKRI